MGICQAAVSGEESWNAHVHPETDGHVVLAQDARREAAV